MVHRWQKQFECILFNPIYEYGWATSNGVNIKIMLFNNKKHNFINTVIPG